MIEFLTYDLKVAVLLAVFYMFYRLMLARETFHRVNRIVLLLTAVASYVLPLCVITIHETVVMQRAAHVAVGSFQVDMMNEEPATPLWQIILPILFIIGMMATLVHTLSSLFRIIRIIRHSEQYPQTDGTTICVTGNASLTPFSWMHYIVMNRSDYETGDAAILAHERGHIRLHHSWDLLFVDTLTALQWFNPAMWMLRSDLKNRINMMLHTKSDRSRLLKLLALLPIVGIALAVNAEKVVDVRYEESQKGIAEKKAETAAAFTTTLKYDTIPGETFTAVGTYEPVQGDVFDVVEEMPQYPGGPQALFKFLGENVQYPAEAEKAGIQGRVIATFVVEKDGSISQPTIVKSVDPLLDAEAIRVISAMPNWIPGKQNGKVVRVKYTVPLSFNLDGGGEEVDRLCREDGTIVEIDIEKGDTTIAKPLFIVDGKVMDGRKVYAINPKTIERYYMQNGQEAIDKYGDKAKDGVILITLKKD